MSERTITLFSLYSFIHSLPREEKIMCQSSQAHFIGWWVSHWVSEARTRLSGCLSSTFRWNSFSCQLLYFFTESHLGAESTLPILLSVTMWMGGWSSPAIFLGYALEFKYRFLHCIKLYNYINGLEPGSTKTGGYVRSPTLVPENQRAHIQIKKTNPISHLSLIVLRLGHKRNK